MTGTVFYIIESKGWRGIFARVVKNSFGNW